MVDTPKDGDGNGTAGDDTSKKQPKRRHQRRRSKSRHSKNEDSGTGDNNTPDSAEDNPLQQDAAQEDGDASPYEGAAGEELEVYTPPSGSAEDNPLQQDAAQEDGDASPYEGAAGEELEVYTPPSGDEAILHDDEFIVPEDPVEQERFKRRLMATANSLKKKQQQLRADQDLLANRWTEVLAAGKTIQIYLWITWAPQDP